jgi:hypothetical protein
VQEADEGIFGFRRVANPGACQFCREVNGAYLKRADAMALHPHCGCGIEPLTEPHPRARNLPNGEEVTRNVGIHQHGELGPLIGSREQDFTGPSDF